ncbi:MAG: cation-translocating P-type ATPase [Chloroflexi bacterium]|nr:cation-translocating P-type ATPase [Chloroflexota bacterium]
MIEKRHTATAAALAYRQPGDDVLQALGSDARCGLSRDEAARRLQECGPNQLEAEPPVPAWRRFLAQFQDTLVILLLLATVVSAIVWLYERDTPLPYEALTILAIVLLNGVLGYVQEARAERAVAALKAMTANEAGVIRDGERQRVPATDLVPGDLILLEEGDTVPSDARVLRSTSLQTAEAALTGESNPIPKSVDPIPEEVGLGDQENMVFSGTAVTYGRGTAVVTATGMRTEMGKIAGLLKDTELEETPLQKELDRTGKLLGIVVLAIAAVMVGTIVFVGDVHDFSTFVDVLILGVALAVAAVPEGLPAIVTAVLAIGVQRMARRHAIVRRLPAVETLGSATIIASDKTGTLTRNEMTVRVIQTASGRVDVEGTGYAPHGDLRHQNGAVEQDGLRIEVDRALLAASLANNAVVRATDGRWSVQGDPTEGALVVAGRKAGLIPADLESSHPRVGEVPFSSERKLMSTVHRDDKDGLLVVTKGAPDILLARCKHEQIGPDVRSLSSERRAEILSTNDGLAGEALRTLGVAYRRLPSDMAEESFDDRLEHDLTWIGLIGMIDPPRAEAKEAVARALGAGVRPIMITGDHPKTAAVIASELGIATDGRAVVGRELEEMSEPALRETVRHVSVYARVNPEHKLRIVKALQANGDVAAMTGDGVNDAPALRSADIGVAMGITGTDVSKEAADMILSDDNFATIVAAVEEGRAIFANIQKFLRYLLSSNIGEVLTMFLGVILAGVLGLGGHGEAVVLPLLATQLLWVNLVTDGPPALALGLDPPTGDLMRRRPRSQGGGVLSRRAWAEIAYLGAVMAIGTLLVLDGSLPDGLIEGSGSMEYARTMAFTTLVLYQMFNVFNARSEDQSAFSGLFRNRWLWLAVTFSCLLQLLPVYVPLLQEAFGTEPLAAADWLVCILVASTVLWFGELGKLVVRFVDRGATS